MDPFRSDGGRHPGQVRPLLQRRLCILSARMLIDVQLLLDPVLDFSTALRRTLLRDVR